MKSENIYLRLFTAAIGIDDESLSMKSENDEKNKLEKRIKRAHIFRIKEFFSNTRGNNKQDKHTMIEGLCNELQTLHRFLADCGQQQNRKNEKR